MLSCTGAAPAAYDKQGTEGCSGGHEKTYFGGEILPVGFPCSVDTTFINDARCASERHCDHSNREAEGETQGYLLSQSDLKLVNDAYGYYEDCAESDS